MFARLRDRAAGMTDDEILSACYVALIAVVATCVVGLRVADRMKK